ncbi:MAG: hypothetical protein IT275_11935 [Chitinophagales bacterium]|nr:hypothetical protein [Chitinophagales bacterium]HMV15292.1 hypothetical protein [Chitinophagales bacterium]HMW13798.1 hypothetical protein [Chitinophagales bacterium]HMX60187.1 hypothetical protein [Chitinophagales bacterium]HMY23231.1 hypothetical protein [Chitinophagales bacterium]
MKNLQYPLSFTFKITTFSNDFIVKDNNGMVVSYIKQKMFRFIEDINIYSDETKSQLNYNIKADRWLDFSAVYSMTNHAGLYLGKIARKGWSSLWKARYEIYDENNAQDLIIHEENAWIKVLDGLLCEIPIIGMVSGYFFNPSYIISRQDGTAVARLKKEPSFWGRKFTLNTLNKFETGEEERLVLGLMMMILLERRRG